MCFYVQNGKNICLKRFYRVKNNDANESIIYSINSNERYYAISNLTATMGPTMAYVMGDAVRFKDNRHWYVLVP